MTAAPLENQRKPLSPLQNMMPYLGCDPEFFFKVAGKVVGAELFLPTDGFKPEGAVGINDSYTTAPGSSRPKVIIDGVQAELNPRPNTCRANLANEIAGIFKALKAELDAKGSAVEVDFSQSVTIDKEELTKLDEKNQKFGCTPSFSAHKDSSAKLETVDPLTHLQRSAGGHIHVGVNNYTNIAHRIATAPEEVVTILDIVCGNTCVLVDRDPGNVKRRELYGRAGEYRLPPHGIEYRTLSNFWLTSYELMSLAFGLARMSIEISCGNGWKEHTEAVKDYVNIDKVRKAINNNDFDAAYENFKALEPFIQETSVYSAGHFPIDNSNLLDFHYFVETVNSNGLKHWFTEDPLTHWCSLPEAHTDGFHHFLRTKVQPLRLQTTKA
jgi:hypothetical protein